MADENTFLPDASNPFPTNVDPMFAPTKTKRAKAIKAGIVSADPSGATMHEGEIDPGTFDLYGKKYKFSEVKQSADPMHNIEDYSGDPNANVPDNLVGPNEGNPKSAMARDLEGLLGGVQNPSDISPHEYQKLTEEAAKGNKLAQQILVKGKFKAKDFPSLSQDLAKIDDPFVAALSGLPALAQNEQANAAKVTQPYDFANAESQVNNLLGQEGSKMQMTTTPETNTYLGQLNNIVSAGANNLTTSTLGLPSIMQALGGLGPAAKSSEKSTPYANLLAALLGHEQYQIEYGGASPGSSAATPDWLQALLAQVTGTGLGGSLVSPTVAAAGLGTTPSTTSTPTGSNG